jgi:hypothetical protein
MVLLKRGKNDGIAVYVPMETILMEMATKIEQVKPPFLFWPSPGTFQYFFPDTLFCDDSTNSRFLENIKYYAEIHV